MTLTMAHSLAKSSIRFNDAEATHAAILRNARRLFQQQGYSKTSMDAIADASGISKGGLYHHFPDKRTLLEAVVIQLQREAMRNAAQKVLHIRDRWQQLEQAIQYYLRCCLSEDYRRIVIDESPAILGTQAWQHIYRRYPGRLAQNALRRLQFRGQLQDVDIDVVGRLLSAMVWECTHIPDQKTALRQIYSMLSVFRVKQ